MSQVGLANQLVNLLFASGRLLQCMAVWQCVH